MEPHDRLDPDRDRPGKAARRALKADDARQGRAARGLSLLRQGRRHQRTNHRRPQQRNLPLFAAASDPRVAPLGRLDGREARCPAKERLQAIVHATRALRGRAQLGSGVMAIVYDKLMALKIPESQQTYTERDAIFYALSLGLGQNPVDEDELRFVYEKDLEVLPTFPCVVAHPGFWAR